MRVLAIAMAALSTACAHRAATVAEVSLPVVASPAPPPKAQCLPRDPRACHEIAQQVLVTDPRDAFMFESIACDGGVVAGCGELGWMVLHGVWGTADPPRAFVLLERACHAGSVESCVRLGAFYRDVRRDDPKGSEVLTHYCNDVGVPSACDELGRMVERGRGFSPDSDAAQRLYEHACARGSHAGCGDLGRVLLGKDDTRALSLLRGACTARDGDACYWLALRDRHPGRAQRRFARACNLGVAAACAAVASLVDVDERSPEALWWMNRACDEADARACERLAERMGSQDLLERARAIGR
ncbi:MAG TPA: tetratricopeptide repeat protein [Polyangiaceae bacterium]|nr:tetratricopeptide repeat protein [Polyangiaceae bacterium]